MAFDPAAIELRSLPIEPSETIAEVIPITAPARTPGAGDEVARRIRAKASNAALIKPTIVYILRM